MSERVFLGAWLCAGRHNHCLWDKIGWREPLGADMKGEAMAKKGFDSMSEAIEKFGGHGVGLSFPLRDDSPASDWESCGTRQLRESWGSLWRTKRTEAQGKRPITPEDFIAVVAYEANGSKFDEKMGWPSLGIWYEAMTDGSLSGRALAINRKELMGVLEQLLDTGASVAAFQALYPEALCGLLRKGSGQAADLALWGVVEMLLERGWCPNKWSPVRSDDGCSSMQALLWESGNVVAHAESVNGIEGSWRGVIGAAVGAGFNLEGRSMSGLTALGGCLRHRSPHLKSEADPRVEALVSMGADPTRTSQFWLANFDREDVVRKRMLGYLEASQIASASPVAAMSGSAGKRRASL